MSKLRVSRGRRALVALVAATTLALAVGLPAMAATRTFKAVVLEDFGRRTSAQPCWEDSEGFYCLGRGTIQGFGAVTSTILFPNDPSQPLERTLELADGSTLVLVETWLDGGSPGRSAEAPGQPRSYGNPWFDQYAWSVADGTGAFAGATGAGTWENVLAGDTIVIRFTGTLELP